MVEEHWLTPSSNRMLAVNRTLVDGQTRAFEYLQIDMSSEQAVYLAQPGGRPAVSFVQSDAGEQRVRFENPDHDFPQFIEYRRAGDELTATIGTLDGEGAGGVDTVFELCGLVQ